MYTHLLNKFKKTEPEWQGSLVKNTLLMIALILDRQTVCLWKLKAGVGKFLGNTQSDSRSHYQRIKRWFWQSLAQKYVWLILLKCAIGLLRKLSEVLILDGTSWQRGGKKYHFLTLSILYRGVAIPIWWLELGHLGISSQKQRGVLLQGLLQVLQISGKILLADREYIGLDWFKALKKSGLDFVIRLRKGNYQALIEKQGSLIEKLEKKAQKQRGKVFSQAFLLGENTYYFVLSAYTNRQGKLEILRLITTLNQAKRAIELYKLRYRIESMFKHLKSNGFDLEALHLQSQRKIRLMMALLVLAYTLSVIEGLKNYKRKYPPLKHGTPAMSVFRAGLDKWQNYLASFELFLDTLFQYFKRVFESKKHPLILNVP